MQCPKCGHIRTEQDSNPAWQCPSCHIAYEKFLAKSKHAIRKYTPNFIPAEVRNFNLIASLSLFAYGTYGICINDLYIKAKRSKGIHLHNEPALIMYAAFICACIVMVSVIIDHYDQRDNEHKYQLVGRIFKISGWTLFLIALFYSFKK